MVTAATHSEDASMPVSEREDADVPESMPQRDMRSMLGGSCTDCGTRYSAREAVVSIFLGLKNAPRCLPCASRRLERDASELQADLVTHFARRECYLRAWQEAEQIDRADGSAPTMGVATNPVNRIVDVGEPSASAEWDAGDMACGELVLGLRMRMEKLPAGAIIRVTATDTAAPEDLPSWCRLCGHTLVAMNHPTYWIRRKGS